MIFDPYCRRYQKSAFAEFRYPYLVATSRVVVKKEGTNMAKAFALILSLLSAFAMAQQAGDRRPNIVLIVTDDMGYADIGSFGGEIATPNIDSLASDGVRFTNFYTHASCSPTRSMLLSGVDTHLNGLGNMSEWTAPNQKGVRGYEGDLNHDVVTLPELLRESGYHTYMTGKWHMGKAPDKIPAARGFERDFSLLDGGGNYWGMTNVSANSPKLVFVTKEAWKFATSSTARDTPCKTSKSSSTWSCGIGSKVSRSCEV